MLSKVFSAAVVGLDAVPVEVGIDIAAQRLPSFTIVGLPDKAVEEAQERVRSAIRNSGADFPAKRITVNLASADLPKEGPSYDLPIAMGILLASGQLQADLRKALIRGELSLDEFPRNVLESLRQPIEDNSVSISRSKGKTTFPAKCILIASQNPCPCGYFGDNSHQCICTATQISRYKKKSSGPLLDRIDIHLDVPAVKGEKLTEQDTNHVENSQTVQQRVQKARDKQNKHYQGTAITSNAELTNKTIKIYCTLSDDCINILRQAVSAMSLSGRAYYRIIKLSRTIADLAVEEAIQPNHIAEALQYRPKGEGY